MPKRLQFFEKKELDAIHNATVDLFSTHGIEFQGEDDRKIFQDNGFKVVGNQVFMTENQLMDTIAGTPGSVELQARNPQSNVRIGGDDYAMAPIYGSNSYVDSAGEMHLGNVAFYEKICKLVQTSSLPFTTPQGACWPGDVPEELGVLEMLYRDVTLTDKPILVTTTANHFIMDALNIASIIFGGYNYLINNPVTFGLGSNPLSPLAWPSHQAEGVRLMSSYNQPFSVTSMMMMGATAPIDIPSTVAIMNTELLAGAVLGRLVSKKSCIIMGTTSCPMDMKSMVAILGSPEAIILNRAGIALAEYYGFPSRGGAALTDSHTADSQAMIDSTLMAFHGLICGANFSLHSLGMLGSYLAASLEKFVLDEEMTHMAMACLKLPEISANTINLDMIKRVSNGESYLTQRETSKNYKNLFRSKFLNRKGRAAWKELGSKTSLEMAREEVESRLQSYVKPEMDPKMEQAITEYVNARRNGRPATKLV